MPDHGETVHHKGEWAGGAEDEYGLVWECDIDCPHPEHADDPDDDNGGSAPPPIEGSPDASP